MIPLFLGADLFSDTDIRSENQPRYHAKFAKRGLATKLSFSSGTPVMFLVSEDDALVISVVNTSLSDLQTSDSRD